MNIPRRKFLQLMAGAAALPAMPHAVRAQTYPSRQVRWIVPFPAGGPADISARLMGQWLSGRLGQPFVIDNRSGAGGNIGTEAAATSEPNGYTLLLAGSFNAINVTLYDNLLFDFRRDIAPVAGIMRNPLIVVVTPSLPVNTIPELIAHAKANPGKLNVGTGGIGSPQHMASELFKLMADVSLMPVHYRGSTPMLTDLLRGELHVAFEPMLAAIEHVRAGKVRALAVTTARRSQVLPDILTVSDFVPGYETSGWTGLAVRKGTPADVVDKLNREVNAGLADATVAARLADLGGTPTPGSPADFGKLMESEIAKWAKVIRAANIKPA